MSDTVPAPRPAVHSPEVKAELPPPALSPAIITSADVKLLVITFAGTVAANIVTVLLVGVAIILARSARSGPPVPALDWVQLGFLPLVALMFAVLYLSRWVHARKTGTKVFGDGFPAFIMVPILILFFIGAAIALLIWVGLASGIK